MQVNNHRPGVYSDYSVASKYSSPRSVYNCALIAKCSELTDNLFMFSSYAQAAEKLGETANKKILAAISVIFDCGVTRCYLAPAGENYTAAYANIADLADIGAVITDCTDQGILAELVNLVNKSSANQCERLLFAGVAATAAETTAKILNSERAVICTPACGRSQENCDLLYTAAAMAGEVLSKNDPAAAFTGMTLQALSHCESLAEADIQNLIAAGVCVMEKNTVGVECIRAATTRTSPDLSLRPLNTVLIIDDVMRAVRSGLKGLLNSMRAKAHSYESIASQITVILAAKQDEGIIESFLPPQVTQDINEPTLCRAEITFNTAQIVEQIHISAYICA